MQILERQIEAKVVQWARKKGVDTRKMNGQGQRFWPDRLFCIPHMPFWIEFKRPGATLYPAQKYVINHLLELGYDVEIHDQSEKAIEAIVRRIVEAARLSEEGGSVRSRERMRGPLFRSRTWEDVDYTGGAEGS